MHFYRNLLIFRLLPIIDYPLYFINIDTPYLLICIRSVFIVLDFLYIQITYTQTMAEVSLGITIINTISCICTVLPPLVGVGLGLGLATEGICKSTEYDLDLTFSIMPMVFTSAPAIYSLLLFFYISTKSPETLPGAIKALGGTSIQGFACAYCGYTMGCISKDASVARAKQKKFTSSYFLLLIFGELIGLLALVLGMVLLTAAK